jgi:hypothetical protein
MAPFPTQPPQEPPLEQFGVQPVGLCPAMFPRNCYTRGMDHVRLDPARFKPARQPKAVAAGFESKRKPRDRAAGPDRLIPPAVQHRKQPFRARVQLLARLTLNTRNDAANQPARAYADPVTLIVPRIAETASDQEKQHDDYQDQPHRCGEDGIGGFADDPLLYALG